MSTTLEALRFTAKMVDGELFEYEDGYIIDCLSLGKRVLFHYSLEGDFEKMEVKKA